MGAYAECWLDTMFVGSTKSEYDDRLMRLFTSADKRIFKWSVREIPYPMRDWQEFDPADVEEVEFVYYTAGVPVIRDRLELLGYTLQTSKQAFTRNVSNQLAYYSQVVEEDESRRPYLQRKIKNLRSADVGKWLARLLKAKRCSDKSKKDAIRLQTQLISDYEEQTLIDSQWYGYSGIDLYVPLRIALEICGEEESLYYNLTDLVEQEYLDKAEDCVAVATEYPMAQYASGSKVIILTEGKSDGWIISGAMKLLYPHLLGYFTFMDFELARVGGGAPQLANIVKSFAGAGIVNKVIALFDNDTIGKEAVQNLQQLKLPSNLRVLNLPDLPTLRKYPTTGPGGSKLINVNGSAASIELYLGDDVLRENGKLLPVKWSNHVPAVGKYQGSIAETDKGKVHKRFREKLRKARNRHDLRSDPNWSGLCAIMGSIFSAFHSFDQRIICEAEEAFVQW
jgi:hypothetical protein